MTVAEQRCFRTSVGEADLTCDETVGSVPVEVCGQECESGSGELCCGGEVFAETDLMVVHIGAESPPPVRQYPAVAIEHDLVLTSVSDEHGRGRRDLTEIVLLEPGNPIRLEQYVFAEIAVPVLR